ncbi:hypothetical protein GA0115257_110325 [Streptomyces sp. LcepLS]|nr:hypothetical protein GA0115257_110325 [Streptomyces sp. LcepLS]
MVHVKDSVARVEGARRRPRGEGEEAARKRVRGAVEEERPRRQVLGGAGAAYVRGHGPYLLSGAGGGGGGGGVCPHSQGDIRTLWYGVPSAPVLL